MPIEVNGNAQEKRMVNLCQSKMIKKTISLLISFNSIQTVSSETIRCFVNTNVNDLSKHLSYRILTTESKSLHLSDLYSTYPLITLMKEDFPAPDSPKSAIFNSTTPLRSSRSPTPKPKSRPILLYMTKTEIYDCLKEMKSRTRFISRGKKPIDI